MVHTAERLAFAYAIAQETLRLALSHIVGWEDTGGTPRWRCYMQMLPHVLVLPLCVVCAVRSDPTRSLRRRGERCADVGLGLPERTFGYIFGYALLADFAYALAWPAILSRLVTAHHVVCLLGHAYTVTATASAFPTYMAAVSALELGSASSNLFVLALAHAPRTAAYVYAAVMTASNLASIALLVLWVRRARPLGRVARGLPAFITLVRVLVLTLILTLTLTLTLTLEPNPNPNPINPDPNPNPINPNPNPNQVLIVFRQRELLVRHSRISAAGCLSPYLTGTCTVGKRG